MTASATIAPSLTIGNGQAIHTAFYVENGPNPVGSLCDPFVYCKGSRMRLIDAAPTCPRCAKATDRAAESAANLAHNRAAGL